MSIKLPTERETKISALANEKKAPSKFEGAFLF